MTFPYIVWLCEELGGKSLSGCHKRPLLCSPETPTEKEKEGGKVGAITASKLGSKYDCVFEKTEKKKSHNNVIVLKFFSLFLLSVVFYPVKCTKMRKKKRLKRMAHSFFRKYNISDVAMMLSFFLSRINNTFTDTLS